MELDIGIEERNITRDELYIAEEVFLSGTAAEITPVREVDNRKIGSKKPGKITKLIQKEYSKMVLGQNPKYRDWLESVRL